MADNTVHNGRLVSNKPSIFDEKQVSKHSERQRHAGSAILSWWKQHSKGTKFMTTFSKCLFCCSENFGQRGTKFVVSDSVRCRPCQRENGGIVCYFSCLVVVEMFLWVFK